MPDISALVAHRVPASSPAARLLFRYLELGQEDHLAASPELQQAFANHVCDVLALTPGATHDSAELAKSRGVAAARLHAVQEDIRQALNRPDLTVHTIATRHGASARYVQPGRYQLPSSNTPARLIAVARAMGLRGFRRGFPLGSTRVRVTVPSA